MALEFINDAISLSGLTGSWLKCEVIGLYYPFWWKITSGGQSVNYEWPTAIVELYAATGEVYIQETKKTILGSSGHALDLKCSNSNTRNLKVFMVENNMDCYNRLKQVITRRWENVNMNLAEGPVGNNPDNIYLLNEGLEDALNSIDKTKLGNALFFFDPLRSVEYLSIEKVASKRINSPYKLGTEFIIFIFTSDWFLGRDDFASLPTTVNEDAWSADQRITVFESDALFGNMEWRLQILNNDPIYKKENRLIELYKNRLHKWFRYVLPMPFNPKKNQIFHLILCSNFETGVRATRNFYCEITGNPKYTPDNRRAFNEFKTHHPEIFQGLSRNERPIKWKMLWSIVTQHEDGICDHLCRDFEKFEQNETKRQESLEWLETTGYLELKKSISAWQPPIKQYKLNWPTIKSKLGIDPPPPLEPLSLRTMPLKEISK